MPDQFSAVNDLVENAAKEIKEKNAGGEEQPKVEQKKEETVVVPPKEEEKVIVDPLEKVADPLDELLKEFKFENKEALLEHLKTRDKKTESPEETKRKDEIYRANLNKFAVESSFMSNEDIVKLETLRQKADRDLVFEKFSSEIKEEIEEEAKEENPDITKEEIDTKIREAFDKEFPLESKNQKAKSRAETRLTKEAKELRGPLESSFTNAKAEFDKEVSIRNAYPEFKKTVAGLITEAVPQMVPFFNEKDGDEEVPVNVPVSEDAKTKISEALSKKFVSPEIYALYSKGKIDEIKKLLASELEYQTWKHIGEDGKREIAKVFRSRGLDKGSNTGAKNSFSTNQAKGGEDKKMSAADAQQQVIDDTRQKK